MGGSDINKYSKTAEVIDLLLLVTIHWKICKNVSKKSQKL